MACFGDRRAADRSTDFDDLAGNGKKCRQSSDILFNACSVGRARKLGNTVDGWAPAVLDSGASGYIGALWPVGDQSAAEFGINFYRNLESELEKNGEARLAGVLQKTRRRYVEKQDPTFLSYVFYGDAHLIVID